MKLHNESILGAFYANAESRRERIIWAPPVLNAAAIFGVANVIANVRDPDSALDMLLGPAWCFIIGAAMGAIANFNYARLGELEAQDAADNATLAAALDQIIDADGLDDHAAASAIDLSTAFICGRMGEGPPSPSADRIAAMEKFDVAQRKLSLTRKKRNAIRRRDLKLLWAVVLTSISLFVGGFGWITVAHKSGVRLVPPQTLDAPQAISVSNRPGAAPMARPGAAKPTVNDPSRAAHPKQVRPVPPAAHH